jgi:hypothetical protein
LAYVVGHLTGASTLLLIVPITMLGFALAVARFGGVFNHRRT